jgi:hypothetical protein
MWWLIVFVVLEVSVLESFCFVSCCYNTATHRGHKVFQCRNQSSRDGANLL